MPTTIGWTTGSLHRAPTTPAPYRFSIAPAWSPLRWRLPVCFGFRSAPPCCSSCCPPRHHWLTVVCAIDIRMNAILRRTIAFVVDHISCLAPVARAVSSTALPPLFPLNMFLRSTHGIKPPIRRAIDAPLQSCTQSSVMRLQAVREHVDFRKLSYGDNVLSAATDLFSDFHFCITTSLVAIDEGR